MKLNDKLLTVIEGLLVREGGYVDHPNDRGGPTNYGITQAVARAYGYDGDMRDLTRGMAINIYSQRYWYEPGFSQVASINEKVAEELFDTGVNMGPGIASRFLQQSLNALNSQGKHYPDLIVDGRIGRMTLEAMHQLIQRRGAAPARKVLLRMLDSLQAARYIEIAHRDQKQEDFMFGWILHRINNVE